MQSQQVAQRAANRLAVYHNRLSHSHAGGLIRVQNQAAGSDLVYGKRNSRKNQGDPGHVIPKYRLSSANEES